MLKLTALASVISLRELLTVTSQQVAVNFRFAELYGAATVWYLAIVSIFIVLQGQLERRYQWSSRAEDARRGAAGDGGRRGEPMSGAAMPGPPIVQASEVHKRYGRLDVLRGVSLMSSRGEVKVIVGPSGSGKSTLPALPGPAGADRQRAGSCSTAKM